MLSPAPIADRPASPPDAPRLSLGWRAIDRLRSACDLLLRRAPWVWPYGLLGLVLALIMGRFWTASALMLGGDAVLASYPGQVFLRDSVAAGEFPWWNPYRLGGSPAFSVQSNPVYPVRLALIGLPAAVALNWLVALHVVLAGLGAAWCARQLGASREGQFLAGLSYALGSATLARLWAGHVAFLCSIAWLPIATGLAIKVGRRGAVERLAVVFGLMILAGQPEVAILCLWWLPAWSAAAAVVAAASVRQALLGAMRSVVRTTLGVSLGLGLAAVVLLPLAMRHSATVRAIGVGWDFRTRASLPPWHLLGLLAPEAFGHPDQGYWPGLGWEWHERLIYVGLVPLALAFRASGRWRWACWAGVAVAVALAFGGYVPWYAWAQALPGYSSFRIPSKHLALAALALALAAGLGIERARGRGFRLGLGLASVGLVLSGLSAGWWSSVVPGLLGGPEAAARAAGNANAGSPAPALVAAAVLAMLVLTTFLPSPWRPRAQLALAALELSLILAPYRTKPWNQEATLALLEPLRAYERAAVTGGPGVVAAQMGPLIRVAQPAGYSSLLSNTYANLVTGGDQVVSVRVDRPDSPVLRLLGIQAVFDDGIHLLHTVPDPKPPAWVARCAWPGGPHEARRPEFPIDQCVTRAGAAERDPVRPPGSAELLEARPGWLVARAQGPGWLVTWHPWYPGWAAWIDGAPAEVEVLDGALVGVALPEGTHTATLRYRPERLELGLGISLATALVLLGLWWLNRPATARAGVSSPSPAAQQPPPAPLAVRTGSQDSDFEGIEKRRAEREKEDNDRTTEKK